MGCEATPTRDMLRSRRKRPVRARTIHARHITKRELETGRLMYPETDYYKPRTRGECVDGPRPCPYVSCRHHLYLDVTEAEGIKLNFPDLEVWDLKESCALDVADRGDHPLQEVGDLLNITRERVRQVEEKLFAALRGSAGLRMIRKLLELGSMYVEPKRRLPVLADRVLCAVEAAEGATLEERLEALEGLETLDHSTVDPADVDAERDSALWRDDRWAL